MASKTYPKGASWKPAQQQIRRKSVDYLASGLDIDGANLNQDEDLEDLPPEVEAVILAVWRRVIKEGGGPELTLPEAAVLLGTSVESVRRRIKAGKIHAFHDRRGRLRIRASLPAAAEAETPHEVALLWEELKAAKHDLSSALSETQGLRQERDLAHLHRREAQQGLQSLQGETEDLRHELRTAQEALEHTQRELASLWRAMSMRRRSSQPLGSMAGGNEAFDLTPSRERLESERSRIQDQIARVRDLSRRRRWPWPQAS